MRAIIHRAVWTLTADEKAMREAEDAMLGAYENHLSRIDWEPMDEDDERPAQVDRIIRAYNKEAMNKLFKVAGYLGDKGIVAVRFDAGLEPDDAPRLASGYLDSAGTAEQFLYIIADEVNRTITDRVNKAVALLNGI